jgi:threonine synthase
VDFALGHYEQALRLCREQNDQEGIRVYLSNLYESQRYLGQNVIAAEYAKELGQHGRKQEIRRRRIAIFA